MKYRCTYEESLRMTITQMRYLKLEVADVVSIPLKGDIIIVRDTSWS